jgi:hypothetical protein
MGAIGALNVSAGTARAQAPVAPRTVYAAPAYRPAGYYYGGRYYQYNYNTAPRYYGYSTAPTRSGYAPGSIYYQYGSPNVRDYSTARNLPFAKPWMRPLR